MSVPERDPDAPASWLRFGSARPCRLCDRRRGPEPIAAPRGRNGSSPSVRSERAAGGPIRPGCSATTDAPLRAVGASNTRSGLRSGLRRPPPSDRVARGRCRRRRAESRLAWKTGEERSAWPAGRRGSRRSAPCAGEASRSRGDHGRAPAESLDAIPDHRRRQGRSVATDGGTPIRLRSPPRSLCVAVSGVERPNAARKVLPATNRLGNWQTRSVRRRSRRLRSEHGVAGVAGRPRRARSSSDDPHGRRRGVRMPAGTAGAGPCRSLDRSRPASIDPDLHRRQPARGKITHLPRQAAPDVRSWRSVRQRRGSVQIDRALSHRHRCVAVANTAMISPRPIASAGQPAPGTSRPRPRSE